MRKIFVAFLLLAGLQSGMAHSVDNDTIANEHDLDEVTVSQRRLALKQMSGAQMGFEMNQESLFRAACCNLGEAFVNNPSVDVNYSDAATGAKEIKLLGLSGRYVQMLTESQPNYRYLAQPFSLEFIPGQWLKSISVSKGASTVKNGFEGMTGQINAEYLQPEDEEHIEGNIYVDSETTTEVNVEGNIHLNKALSTELLLHASKNWMDMDNNGDGFMDTPRRDNYNIQNRWAYLGEKYIGHYGISALKDKRRFGMSEHFDPVMHTWKEYSEEGGVIDKQEAIPLWKGDIDNERFEMYMKHAFILNREHGTNIAWMVNGSLHNTKMNVGDKPHLLPYNPSNPFASRIDLADFQGRNMPYKYSGYDAHQRSLSTQLMFESSLGKYHNISLGASLSLDAIDDTLQYAYATEMMYGETVMTPEFRENTIGGYAQYTFNLNSRLIAMAGVRVDNSSIHGTFVTPRAHVKWQIADWMNVKLSAGKGYRTVHPFAENYALLASGRNLSVFSGDIAEGPQEKKFFMQEESWNMGAALGFDIPIGNRNMKLNAEYFYTTFQNQMVIDYRNGGISIGPLDRHNEYLYVPSAYAGYFWLKNDNKAQSYSHVIQVDAQYEPVEGLELLLAFRRNIVKQTVRDQLLDQVLMPKFRGLFTASWKPGLGLWQFDVNVSLTGKARLEYAQKSYEYAQTSYDDDSYEYSPVFATANLQVTRWFRQWSVYAGVENLTGYKQKDPVRNGGYVWYTGNRFDNTQVWGPTMGQMVYLGLRIKL